MSIQYQEFIEIVQNTFQIFPVISDIFDKNGNEYILRQHQLSDAEDYMKFYNIPEIARFLPDGLIFRNISEAESEIKFRQSLFTKKESIYWCIAEKKTNKLIGG